MKRAKAEPDDDDETKPPGVHTNVAPNTTTHSPSTKRKKMKGERKSGKKPKDMPRPPLNAYNMYFREQRAVLSQRASKSGKEVTDTENFVRRTEIFHEIGKRWRELGDVDRAKYQKLAEEDAKRYREEIQVYQQKIFCEKSAGSSKHAPFTDSKGQTLVGDTTPPPVALSPIAPAAQGNSFSHSRNLPSVAQSSTFAALQMGGSEVSNDLFLTQQFLRLANQTNSSQGSRDQDNLMQELALRSAEDASRNRAARMSQYQQSHQRLEAEALYALQQTLRSGSTTNSQQYVAGPSTLDSLVGQIQRSKALSLEGQNYSLGQYGTTGQSISNQLGFTRQAYSPDLVARIQEAFLGQDPHRGNVPSSSEQQLLLSLIMNQNQPSIPFESQSHSAMPSSANTGLSGISDVQRQRGMLSSFPGVAGISNLNRSSTSSMAFLQNQNDVQRFSLSQQGLSNHGPSVGITSEDHQNQLARAAGAFAIQRQPPLSTQESYLIQQMLSAQSGAQLQAPHSDRAGRRDSASEQDSGTKGISGKELRQEP